MSRLQKWGLCLGNLFEHYETALFAFLSPFLASQFFPKWDPVVALLATYGMIPLGMLARPIGSIVFGRIGDRVGRGRALFFTLGGMGVISLCIGAMPAYDQVGIWAPVALGLGRVAQNFFAAGETMGGAVYLLEQVEEGRRDLMSGIYNGTTVAGALLASYAATMWGECWRALYVAGAVTALFGALLRMGGKMEKLESSAIKVRELIPIVIASGFGYANYAIALILMNGFIPLITSYTAQEMLRLNTVLLLVDCAALPFFGWVADRFGRERVMMSAALVAALGGVPLFWVLGEGNVIVVRMALVMIGVAFFAPFHAWAQRIVPRERRYGTISLGYAIGSQVLGAPLAALSLWFFQQSGMISSVAWYWSLLAAASVWMLGRVRYAD